VLALRIAGARSRAKFGEDDFMQDSFSIGITIAFFVIAIGNSVMCE
jgi:hypothetical protein